ncbi:hypothetical protein BHM03_00038090 [Ensete ventricosum]|nr:hypothetical protein BHM03_00038090 [Ensete ventricosum]
MANRHRRSAREVVHWDRSSLRAVRSGRGIEICSAVRSSLPVGPLLGYGGRFVCSGATVPAPCCEGLYPHWRVSLHAISNGADSPRHGF